MRENVIHQQSSAVCHPARPATGAKTAAFTTERHQFFVMAGLTANPQKSMFKPSAFQVLFKFLRDVGLRKIPLDRSAMINPC
jgi:hypothetical protein